MSREGPSMVVFPGAGSFGGELRALLRELRPSAWMVRYPGRAGEDFGTGAGSFGEVVRACVTQIRRRNAALPILLGHSYGAYVAYATAARMQQQGIESSALVVVGATAPQLLAVPDWALRSRSDIAAYLQSIDPEMLSDENSVEWRDIIIDAAWQDLRLLRGFRTAEQGRLRCPILAARGQTDPLTSDDGLSRWGEKTTGGCSRRMFSGGHSELLGTVEFTSWLRQTNGVPL